MGGPTSQHGLLLEVVVLFSRRFLLELGGADREEERSNRRAHLVLATDDKLTELCAVDAP